MQMEAPLGTAPSSVCAPRTSCRSAVLVQLAQTAMAYLFTAWLLSAGHAPQVVGVMVIGLLVLISVVTRPAPNLRAALQRALEVR
jgi:hypothetical protein